MSCSPPPVINIQPAHIENDEDMYVSIRKDMRRACETHGCFYLQTRKPDAFYWGDDTRVLENLFERVGTYASNDHKGSSKAGFNSIYRGIYAESGAGSSSTLAEPKQSLEWQRRWGTTGKVHGVDDNMAAWTDFMHKTATKVGHFLGLPKDLLAVDDSSKTIDLLRVFRYDAVPRQDRCDNHSDKSTGLLFGSSPHTDWGSITIVWQDSVGGLQRYCPVHTNTENWVDVPPVKASCSSDLMLFVHIGDFLSIASKGKWLSPRHRVVCPNETSRYSFVYFAYPKHGVTLSQAEKFLPLHNISLSDGGKKLTARQCGHYSLLQNQSKGDSSGCEAEDTVYVSILDVPFDEVIARKWGQVQRDL